MSKCPNCKTELVEIKSLSEERKNDRGTLDGFTYSWYVCNQCKKYWDGTLCWCCDNEEFVEIIEDENPDLIQEIREYADEWEISIFSNLSVILYVDGGGGKFKNSKTGEYEIRGNSVIYMYSEDLPVPRMISIKDSTNNEAELLAILEGIKILLKNNIERAIIYSDSQLAVKGLNGEWNINAPNLKPIAQQIWDICIKEYDIVQISEKDQLAHKK